VLINLQPRYEIRTAALRGFVHRLRRQLRLGKREFNACFVDDAAIRKLNFRYRGKDHATDVLSFPWDEARKATGRKARAGAGKSRGRGIANFLGEVVISVETARRNAATEGHSTLNELRWLILHGVLHLLGYDHEKDRGEMAALELRLREKLGVTGIRQKMQVKGRNANGKAQR
jgi:probable rRNA maturation factor